MTAYQNQYYSAVALFRIAEVMHAAAGQMRSAAHSLHAWLERRRREAIALDEFAAMSERDLRDIGLSRADVLRVAWGVPDRNCDLI